MSEGVFVYWLPHCTTSQRIVRELEAEGVPVAGYRDVKAERLSEGEVRELADMAGGPERLFSRRAMKYREMGLHERTLSDEDLVRLMAEEYTFIARPVLVRAGRASAGSVASRIRAFLDATAG